MPYRDQYVPRSDYRPATWWVRLKAYLLALALLGLLAALSYKGYLVFTC